MTRRTALQDLLEMILLFLAFFLPGFLYPRSLEDLRPLMIQSILVSVPQVLLLLYLLWLRLGSRRSPGAGAAARLGPAQAWGEYGLAPPRARDLLHALAIFGGLLFLFAAAAALSSLLPALPRRLLEQGFRFRLGRPGLLPLAAAFALTTAYREELFFRCYLITRLRHLSLPGWAAAMISTAVFAVGHLYQGAAGLIVAALLGGSFALLFLRRPGLHRLAIAHALYNLAVLAATLLVTPGGASSPSNPPGWTATFTLARIWGILGFQNI